MPKKKSLTPKSLAKLGGEATLKKYGAEHYRKMVAKRWSNSKKAKKLAAKK